MGNYYDNSDGPSFGIRATGILALGALGFGLFLTVLYFVTSTANIDTGHVGVVKHWGQLDNNTLGPGFHAITPFQDNVVVVNTQAVAHEFKEASAGSKPPENQNVYVDGKVLYHVDAKNAPLLVAKVGGDGFSSTIFDPFFQDYLKEETVKYNALDMPNHRPEIRDAVLVRLQALGKTYGVDVDGVAVTNIHYDKTYENAIQDRAVQQQKLAQADLSKQTAITQAQGEAEANRIKQQQITDNTLKQKELDNQAAAIQVLHDKWDGKLPQTVVSSNNSPASVLVGSK